MTKWTVFGRKARDNEGHTRMLNAGHRQAPWLRRVVRARPLRRGSYAAAALVAVAVLIGLAGRSRVVRLSLLCAAAHRQKVTLFVVARRGGGQWPETSWREWVPRR